MIYIVVTIAIVIAFWLFGDVARLAKSAWHKQPEQSLQVDNPPPPKTKSKKADNFKRIYGIGPELEKALHKAGIKSYKDLANTDVATLEQIVDKVNPLLDPSSWPAQAALAADGNWDRFKKMYAQLQVQEAERRQVATG